MKRGVLAVVIGAICSINVAHAEDAKPGGDPTKVDRPTHRVGDTWTYVVVDPISRAQTSEFVSTTISVDESVVKTEVKRSSASPGFSVMDHDGRLLSDTQRAYTPPKQTYIYPMEVGKKWEYSSTFPYQRCGTSRIDMKAEVVGWETVTVPAGTFRALRVDHTGYWNNCLGSDKHHERYWYVPSMKTSVKVEVTWGTGGGGLGGNAYELKSANVVERAQ